MDYELWTNDKGMRNEDYNRQRTSCCFDDQEGNRTRLKWALALGFESEGLMLCYGANGDHWLRVAWVRN